MSAFRYDPELRQIRDESIPAQPRIIARVLNHTHLRDPSLGHTMAAAHDLLEAAREIDRLSLVIESAVRNADSRHHDAVVTAIKDLRAAIKKATAP